MEIVNILIGILMFLMIVNVLFILTRYKKCPPDKILVIYGRVSEDPSLKFKILTSGASFVWPVIQKHVYLDASAKEFEVFGLTKSKDNRSVSFKLCCIGKISTDNTVVEKAVELFYTKSELEISEIVKYSLKNKIEDVINNGVVEGLEKKLKEALTIALEEIGMELVAIKELEVK